MSKTTQPIGMNWRQRACYQVLRGFLLGLRILSVRQCARFGAGLGDWAFRFMKGRRRNVIHNLRIVCGGEKTFEECEALGREVFRRTGANIVGGLRGGLLPDARMGEVVEVRGQENMRAALSEGHGVIALLAHMGPWEILAQIGEMLFLGAPFGSLYRPIDNLALDALVRAERGKRGARLFDRNAGWAGPVDLLREGGALVVLADQRAGGAGIPAPFFGREVLTSRLPYILHRKTGAALVTMSAWTREPGKWIVQIHPPVFPEREEMGGRDPFTRRCNHLLEETLRVSLEDGFWLHRRFRPEVKTFFPTGVSEAGSLPARRALVVLPDEETAAVACARGIAMYAVQHPRASFVVAGKHAQKALSEEALTSVDDLVSVPDFPARKELIRRVLEVDRQGSVGIDGALIFPGADFLFWCGVLESVGFDRILGPSGEEAPRGVRQPFSAPDEPGEPESWLALLESVSAAAPNGAAAEN